MIFQMCMCFCFLLFPGIMAVAPPTTPPPEPFKAVVARGMLLHCDWKRNGIANVDLDVFSLKTGAKQHRIRVFDTMAVSPVRWQIKDNFLIVAASDGLARSVTPFENRYFGVGSVSRWDLPNLLKNELRAVPEAPILKYMTGLTSITPTQQVVGQREYYKFAPEVYSDYLPRDGKVLRTFVVTNIPTTNKSPDLFTEEEVTVPSWTFEVFRTKTIWDAKQNIFKNRPWFKELALPVFFREPFFVFEQGRDWYFLTRSGHLWRVADPLRECIPLNVYKDSDRPIIGQIQDAAAGKTFLFLDPETPKGKPAFFEAAKEPVLVEYDPKIVDVPDGDTELQQVKHRTQVLLKLGRIKLQPAKAKP